MPRVGSLLLVASLVAARASVPFAHVHAHGSEPGTSAPGVDAHCAGHHQEGAHWHLPGTTTDDGAGCPTIASAHGHAAVALDAGGLQPAPPQTAPFLAVTGAGEPPAIADPHAAAPLTTFPDGPDPPPRSAASTRAPPPPR